MAFKELPDAGERLRVENDKNEIKVFHSLQNYSKKVRESKEAEESFQEKPKIKFKNRWEKRKFYSGKPEEIERKYRKQVEDLEEIIEFKEMKKQDTTKLNQELQEKQKILDDYLKEEVETFNVILKTGDYGTLEVLNKSVGQLKDKNGNYNLTIFKAEVGPVTETDLLESLEFDARIYTMDSNIPPDVRKQAQIDEIKINSYKIIYELLDDLKALNNSFDQDDPDNWTQIGSAVVKEVFEIKINKKSNI